MDQTKGGSFFFYYESLCLNGCLEHHVASPHSIDLLVVIGFECSALVLYSQHGNE